MEIALPQGAAVVGKRIVEVGLPQGALIVLLSRDGEFLIPSRSTVLAPGDTLLVLADKAELPAVRARLRAVEPSASNTG